MGLLYEPTPLQYALLKAKDDILKARQGLQSYAIGMSGYKKMHRQLRKDFDSLTATLNQAFAEVDAMTELYVFEEQDNRNKRLMENIYGENK